VKCLAILTSVAALTVVGPAGLASAENLPGPTADADASTRLSSAAGPITTNVRFRARHGLSLGKPTVEVNDRTRTLDQYLLADGKGAGYRLTYNDPARPSDQPAVRVAWPLQLGQAAQTEYTVKAGIGYDEKGRGIYGDCVIHDPKSQPSDRYVCSLKSRDGTWSEFDLIITDRLLVRVAEASGTISTVGTVSLKEGKFGTESKRFVSGAEAVLAGSPTQFDTTLKPADKANVPGLAQGRFIYALFDEGQPVLSKETNEPLYVLGEAHNHNESGVLRGGSSCQIVTGDVAHLPVKDSGYSCDMNGYYAAAAGVDDRAQYFTDFTISEKW
jgi:hypothetical protein